jgi:arylformamidase
MSVSADRRIYDISRQLASTTAGWPGDVPYAFRFHSRIREGASVNVGSFESSVHTATHCDAPFHFDDNGPTIDRVSLTAFLGPARVVDVRDCPTDWGRRLRDLNLQETPRILFHTGGWPDSKYFPNQIPVMEASLPDLLGRLGVVLLGVDLPSVDALDSKTLDNHHALGRHGIAILEGLWLTDVPEGCYELIAPPLKMIGADGSPLRALLRNM